MRTRTKRISAWLICAWLAGCGGSGSPAETFATMFADSICDGLGKCVAGVTATGIMRCKVASKDILNVDVQAVSKGMETFDQMSADQCITQVEKLDCATLNGVAQQDPQATAEVDAKAPACNTVFATR